MAVAGLYRRILPSPPAIEFASSEGKQLFAEALQSGTMEGFFRLISYFQTQSEPAYCGLASLSVVLNALAIDPGRKWKGPWRWFDESMLDCCEPLERVKAEGITFGKVACLAHCAGAKVEAFHTTQSNIDDFRSHIKKCATSEDCHLIASYHRKPFKQTGTGHFSPIGGYHAGRDMALILDVARFKYPPHWVPVSLLWEAMDTVDGATGQPRGFMLISRLQAPPLLYTLSCKHESWASTAKFLTVDVPILLKSDDLKTVPEVLSVIFQSLPAHAGDFIKWIAEVRRQDEDGSSLSNEEKARIAAKEEVLKQVHETKLFNYVTDWLSSARLQFENLPTFVDKDSLTEIAANVCCQGAEILTGCHRAKAGFYCKKTCVTCLKSNGDNTTAIISGTVISGHNEQGVDVLLPSSPKKKTGQCTSCPANVIVTHPASNDILTVLLLALPPQTWTGLKDQKLSSEIQAIVSDENLLVVLREEVVLLRRQLHFLKGCKDNEVENVCQMP
ncbi:glutathione gamma-glutamylcysteinyltransferase 1-like isoform X1 [Dioscorea cayenensis subsp. rotundata]|uniref:glutathione gamma-glutamylcysteinyltransferase n=1 Tax=Dioscorea cayennensis subsp. rotundata TaxID=55577 RepID=A0AB40BP16_DIOCR|nr:glutathione gamma-glutamylcysteinyltransferase 1-like isoform X1 [Dioscorea cayenensis subsp. rotundata]